MGVFTKLAVLARRLRQKRILFAWELGGGLGHIGPLRAVAQALREALPGYVPAFALRDQPHHVDLTSAFPGAKIYPAPVFRSLNSESGNRRSAYNYPDILSSCGYGNADTLGDMMVAWRGLFEDVRPDLIVCDHSPTVILAAAGRIPVVHFGTGFTIPPQGQPYLPLMPRGIQGAAQRERIVLQSIQEACRRLEAPVPDSTYNILTWAENIPCCLPEIDPYRMVRKTLACGPVEKLPPPCSGIPSETIFGYLSNKEERLPEILKSLADSGLKCDIFVRGGIGPYERLVRNSRLRLLDEPRDLRVALLEAGGIMHHGGAATTQVALAMGRPQFLLPRHAEQALTAGAIEGLKCGMNLRRSSDVGAAIKRALQQQAHTVECTNMANEIANQPLRAMETVSATCTRLITKAPVSSQNSK